MIRTIHKKQQAIARFLLIIMGINVLSPLQTYARTTDNTVPPSFQSVAAGHSIDLYSGDFNYSLPLLKVPSPTGDYPIVINYKSGIRLNQESSWCGLGFSLQPGGCIYRTIAQYPDDYFNSKIVNKVYNAVSNGTIIDQGSGTNPSMYGLRGAYWASNGNQVNAFQTARQRYVFNEHFEHPNNNCKNIVNLQSSATKVDFAYGSLYQSNMPVIDMYTTNINDNSSIGQQVFEDPAWNSTFITNLNNSEGINVTAKDLSLSSDVSAVQPNLTEQYNMGITPVQMAYDNYIVSGDFSGKLQPFRYDNPSVAFPYTHNYFENSLTQKPIEKYNVTIPQSSTKKVQFRVVGDPSVNYDHLNRTKTFGQDEELKPYLMDFNNAARFPYYNINNSCAVYGEYLNQSGGCYFKQTQQESRSDVNIEKYVIPHQTGTSYNYNNNSATGYNATTAELAGANYTEWFTNEEFANGTAKTGGFITHNTADFNRDISNTYPVKGVGGFKITDASGTTYHYSIPVYTKSRLSKQFTVQTNQTTLDNYINTINDKYAEYWLLTTVTGPDFIDRNSNGVADAGDDGYYIKYDYGKWEDNFKWRFPYAGSVFDKTNINKRSYEQGVNELYYLNSISTRTHTAIFLKGIKKEGKSYIDPNISNDPLKSSLRLEEIILLKNEDWNSLKSGISFTNNNILSSDLASVSSQLKTVQIQRVVLNYDYSLCKNTPNSFDAGSPNTLDGKLTLKGISTYYKSDAKTTPDYLFAYDSAHNPDFNYNAWDDWGYYKNITTETTADHDVKNNSTADDAFAWNLTKITAPAGGELTVVYERDDYFTQWKEIEHLSSNELQNGYILKTKGGKGDGVRVKQTELKDPQTNNKYITTYTYTVDGTATGTSSGINGIDPGLDMSDEDHKLNLYKYKLGIKIPDAFIAYGKVTVSNKPDNTSIRNQSGKVEYNFFTPASDLILYNSYSKLKELSDKINCASSTFDGSIFNDLLWDVQCPLVTGYHDVTASNPLGALLSGTAPNLHKTGAYWNNKVYEITYRTSKLGALKSKKVYDSNNDVLEENIYQYYDDQIDATGQPLFKDRFPVFGIPYGVITQACNVSDRVMSSYFNMFDPTLAGTSGFDFNRDKSSMTRLINTVTTYYPNVLYRVINKSKGLSTTVEYTKFDAYSGAPTEIITDNGNGEKYKSAGTLAYKIAQYQEMGSKADNKQYKNMLNKEAAKSNFLLASGGDKIIATTATTWNKSWTYRTYNTGTGVFGDVSESGMWRPYQNFLWKSLLNADGTAQFTNGTNEFDFSQNYQSYTNPEKGWQKTSEIKYYDHDSKVIETADINGNSSAVKYGYSNTYGIAAAGSANYRCIAYSGAESTDGAANYFSGEVLGSTKQYASASYSHTGNYCLRLSPGDNGFEYKGAVGAIDFKAGETYRTSVWVHQSNASGAILYCNLKNGTSVINAYTTGILQASTKKAGAYYLLTLDVAIPASTTATAIEFGTQNPADNAFPIYMDDFRVHPLSTPITASVYDEKTGALKATLDKENFATRFYYDAANQLIRTDVETMQGFIKTGESAYNFGRQ